MRILIIEDQLKVAQSVQHGLEAERFDVTVAATGEEGHFLVSSQVFDLLVLDLMLPGCDGLEILRALRNRGLSTPVIILSARDTVEDRIRGLDLGADDYLIKPFAFGELLARIRALLRRGRGQDVLHLVVADLEIDRVARRVTRAAMPIELTAREYELLEYLALHQGRVVSREMLARDVWHEVQRATPLDNVIDVHIARLRRKIDHDRDQPLIHTLRGVGFVLGDAAP
ncbi:response regulator transcription factor [Azospira restricta]|uniref:Response regulator transcription factor n=1 Tax=Azospira restricta TaxID=404405 RepID=A0A974SQL8_9RHOO|nr:response regulator transcription factor [Azospira restricta]QRJ64589.1 response regulator transcription factor [Azospira restricta]